MNPGSSEMHASGAARPLVCVVDDDESVREALPDLLCELGFSSQAFSSAADFLKSGQQLPARALIIDVSMPGMTGPELFLELKRRGHDVPVIFITAHADSTLLARLFAEGACACLSKPFSDTAILEAVSAALAKN